MRHNPPQGSLRCIRGPLARRRRFRKRLYALMTLQQVREKANNLLFFGGGRIGPGNLPQAALELCNDVEDFGAAAKLLWEYYDHDWLFVELTPEERNKIDARTREVLCDAGLLPEKQRTQEQRRLQE